MFVSLAWIECSNYLSVRQDAYGIRSISFHPTGDYLLVGSEHSTGIKNLINFREFTSTRS